MHLCRWGLVAMLAIVACAPKADRQTQGLLEQGRLYTSWLYGSQYEKLWNRFSPDMRASFGSVSDLASFAGRALSRLGPERRVVDERVDETSPDRVYTRAASFDKARNRMLIEWSLAQDGEVTGFVVRPEPSDSK